MIYYLLELPLSDKKNDKLLKLGYHSGNIYSFQENKFKILRKYRYFKHSPKFYIKEINLMSDQTFIYLFNRKYFKNKFEYYKEGYWYTWSESIIDDFRRISLDTLAEQVLKKDRDIFESQLDVDSVLTKLKKSCSSKEKSILESNNELRLLIQRVTFSIRSDKRYAKKYGIGKPEFKKKVREFLESYNNLPDNDSDKLEIYCDFLELYPSAIDIPGVSRAFKIWVSSLGISFIKLCQFQPLNILEEYNKLSELQRHLLENFKPGCRCHLNTLLNSTEYKYAHLRDLLKLENIRLDLDNIQVEMEQCFYTKRHSKGLMYDITGYKRC